MISCRLKGGLGNMMFQIAFTEYEGMVNNFKTGYWNVDQNINHLNGNVNHCPDLNHAIEYLKIFNRFKWHKINKPPGPTHNVPFHFEGFNVRDNIMYDGFFQSEKYFPNRKFILDLFSPSFFVNEQLNKYNHILEGTTCSIHIRRGDYLKYGLHSVRDISYYKKGMEAVGEVDRYLIFSDDIEWCKNNFKGNNLIFIENEKDYVELFLQSKCTHNIISSSSFSWWGAYLNNKPNRKTVGPKQWFTTHKVNNIVPESWITI